MNAVVDQAIANIRGAVERFEALVEAKDREGALVALDAARRETQMLSQTLDAIRRGYEQRPMEGV